MCPFLSTLNIFSKNESLDNFVTLKAYANGVIGLPFKDIQREIRSDSYNDYASRQVNSSELIDDQIENFYGKNNNKEDFRIKQGDKGINLAIINVLKSILKEDIKTQKRIFNGIQYPMDQTEILRPDLEKEHLQSLILKRSGKTTKVYESNKNKIKFDL